MAKNSYICDCNAINQELVQQVRRQMPEENAFLQLADFYKIMGDATRCKLIFALLQQEMCVCDLASLLSMTKSSISHQLGKMKNAGIVKCRNDGRKVFYSLDDHHVSQIFTITADHLRHKQKGANL